jgi:hypothetical protein
VITNRAVIYALQIRNMDFRSVSPWTCVVYKHPDVKEGNDKASGNKQLISINKPAIPH